MDGQRGNVFARLAAHLTSRRSAVLSLIVAGATSALGLGHIAPLDAEANRRKHRNERRRRRRDRQQRCESREGQWCSPPPNAKFDYQIGGDYPPPRGVRIVSRDWFSGAAPPEGIYGICYVNAFQTQADESGERPDEKSNWPQDLVLTNLGDDPNWGGEYLIDITTPEKRQAAADHVTQMIKACATKGFQGVEFDNLDSWTRFDGTPLANDVPFGKAEAIAYAKLLAGIAHANGLAAAQKNSTQITKNEALNTIGFDFAIAEECGRYRECGAYRAIHGNKVIVIEYRARDFRKLCRNRKLRKRLSIVLRDRNVTRPGSGTYVYDAC